MILQIVRFEIFVDDVGYDDLQETISDLSLLQRLKGELPSEKATLKAQKNMFLLQYSQLSQEFADDDENLDRFGFALCQTFSKFEDQVDFCKKSRFLPGYKKYVHVNF